MNEFGVAAASALVSVSEVPDTYSSYSKLLRVSAEMDDHLHVSAATQVN